MNELTRDVIDRFLELKPTLFTRVNNNTLWQGGSIIIGSTGDVNYAEWHNGSLEHDYFKFDDGKIVCIETQEQADEFYKIVCNYYQIDDCINLKREARQQQKGNRRKNRKIDYLKKQLNDVTAERDNLKNIIRNGATTRSLTQYLFGEMLKQLVDELNSNNVEDFEVIDNSIVLSDCKRVVATLHVDGTLHNGEAQLNKQYFETPNGTYLTEVVVKDNNTRIMFYDLLTTCIDKEISVDMKTFKCTPMSKEYEMMCDELNACTVIGVDGHDG